MPLYAYRGIEPKIDPSAFVHPDAVIIGDVVIGPDASIWPGVVIRGDVNRIRIGARTNVQDNSTLHVTRPKPSNPHGVPLLIGDDVTIAHNVMLHACRVENCAMIGMSATLMDGVAVGAWAVVGSGSLVPPGKNIGKNQLWLGAPAKYLRDVTEEEKEGFAKTTANYIRLKEEYRNLERLPNHSF